MHRAHPAAQHAPLPLRSFGRCDPYGPSECDAVPSVGVTRHGFDGRRNVPRFRLLRYLTSQFRSANARAGAYAAACGDPKEMSVSGGSESSSEYWPGFVDALTNVVIAMIFVIVVIAISLSFAMQMIVTRAAESVSQAEAAKSRAEATLAEMTAAVASARTTIIAPGGEALRTTMIPRDAEANDVAVNSELTRITVLFPSHALLLDPDTSARIGTAARPLLTALQAAGQRGTVALTARGPSMQLSDNQRAAYIRLMAVRSSLVAAGLSGDRISIHIDTASAETEDSVIIETTTTVTGAGAP